MVCRPNALSPLIVCIVHLWGLNSLSPRPSPHSGRWNRSVGVGGAVGWVRGFGVMGAEARDHGFEALPVGIGDGDKAKTEAGSAADMADEGVGLNAAFLDEELQLGGHAFLDSDG